jgi:transposase InsO family protein
VDLREEFVLKAMEPGANKAELCRDYGVARKTGYKWIARFEAEGVEGLRSLSRRPRRAVSVAGEVVLRISELREAHPRWGPKKLRALLARELGASKVPSSKTIGRVLDRLGKPRLRKPWKRMGGGIEREAPVHSVSGPNDLWTVDFKGWWKVGDGARCEPLTVRDQFSRYVLCAKAMPSTAGEGVRKQFERLFDQYGLPSAIHVDNGSPFGSTRARGGLTHLSAWWVALGINVVFSRPGQPQDNGGHERMHRDMLEVEQNASASIESEQAALDRWVHEFNHVRPHEALDMKTPADLYRRSSRPNREPRKARYAPGLERRLVNASGHIRYWGSIVFVGGGLAGFTVGIQVAADGRARLQFYELDLGELDLAAAPRREGGTTHNPSRSARCSTRSATKAPRAASEPEGGSHTASIAPPVAPRQGDSPDAALNPADNTKEARKP